ncbi:concanavalin A-like lectin/glucanase domain-containing protein, partial [Immersiella caudata]
PTNNTYCANAWNTDNIGFQCLAVGPDLHSFASTSHWSSLPVTIVKSYPHVKLGSPVLPLPLANISTLALNVNWSLGTNASVPGAPLDVPLLTKQLNTINNVAFDIWADPDPVRAANESQASIEIMIWLAVLGHVNPLGWDKPTHGSIVISPGLNFTLYSGEGPNGQKVLTWFPEGNYTNIRHDFSPLVKYLVEKKHLPGDAFVGTVAFGAESFFSEGPVTFKAEGLEL